MSDLFKVAGPAGEPSASVLLVHGLGGHAYNTWRRGGGKQSQLDETFWPRWLADDVIGCAAPVSRLRGTAMHLTDQATNVLNRLIRCILRSTIAKSPSPCRTAESARSRRTAKQRCACGQVIDRTANACQSSADTRLCYQSVTGAWLRKLSESRSGSAAQAGSSSHIGHFRQASLSSGLKSVLILHYRDLYFLCMRRR